MPDPVTPEVVDAATEAAARAIATGQTGSPDEAPVYELDAQAAVRAAAPLLLEAGAEARVGPNQVVVNREDLRTILQFSENPALVKKSLRGSPVTDQLWAALSGEGDNHE